MSNYTKGKWELTETEVKIANTSKSICAINRNIQEYNYNATLIAAAPDLLEALLKLKEAIDAAAFQKCVHVLETDEVNMINAAILKAVNG